MRHCCVETLGFRGLRRRTRLVLGRFCCAHLASCAAHPTVGLFEVVGPQSRLADSHVSCFCHSEGSMPDLNRQRLRFGRRHVISMSDRTAPGLPDLPDVENFVLHLRLCTSGSAHWVCIQRVRRTRWVFNRFCALVLSASASTHRKCRTRDHQQQTPTPTTHSVSHRQVLRTRWVFNRFCTLDPALQAASAYSHAASPGSRQISRMKIARHNSRKTKQPEVTTPTGQAHDTTAARQNSLRTRHPHDSPKTNSPKQKQTPPHTATRPA